jgi:electron transfer flavoprotein alpha subunit
METILFLAHTENDGTLGKPAREALTAAANLAKTLAGSTLVAGLWGEKVQAAADAIAGCGATAIHGATGPELGAPRYSTDTAAAAALVRATGATLVVAPGTSRAARALPGAAARTGGRIETHIAGLQTAGDAVQARRWYYRQRMVATLSRTHRPWFLLVDPGTFEAWAGPGGTATVASVPVELPGALLRTRVEGLVTAATSAQTIRPEADLLFVAGAGWTKKQADGQTHVKEAETLILGFLEKSGASLGGSKSLVEQSGEGHDLLSFMTHLNQVGQTGATPRHPKGLATCCHGEEPHVVGWRFINERRAVNKDPACGWARGKTDVLYVADAFEVIAQVIDLLGRR